MGQTFVRHAGHSEENEGIPWQGELTLAGREGESQRYIRTACLQVYPWDGTGLLVYYVPPCIHTPVKNYFRLWILAEVQQFY